MIFVNKIADIVHHQVDKYGGSANKNIGDAFLLAWKFKDEDTILMGEDLKLRRTLRTTALADLSLFSFIKIIAKINRFEEILEYRNNPGLNARIKDY